MLQTFGFGFCPPIKVYDRLKILAELHGKTVSVVMNTHVRVRANILVFLSVKDFYSYYRAFTKQKAVAVIFDSALRLMDVNQIKLLDSEILPAGIFMQQRKPKKSDYLAIVYALRNKQPVESITRSRNVINELIKINIKDRFLNCFTEFLYSVSAGEQRNFYKSSTIDLLMGRISIDTFDRNIRKTFKRKVSKSITAYKAMHKYLTSKVGARFIKALAACKGSNDPKVFDSKAKLFRVDAYELRYIVILGTRQQESHH